MPDGGVGTRSEVWHDDLVVRVDVERLRKVFPDGTVAVDDVDLSIADGERFVLLGPSGCGKTTVLRILAGLERATSGCVRFDDRIARGGVEQGLAMMFQQSALYPYRTVRQNISFPLEMARTDRGEIDRRVVDVAERLGIADVLDVRPHRLSGGQRQRVAMGRAMVRDPRILLMDEPMSNLDAKLRSGLRAELVEIQRHLAITALLVTHDQVEAMSFGDRIAVMRSGRVVQVGAPLELYRHPTDVFVASFLGSPAMNLVAGTVAPAGRDVVVGFGSHELVVVEEVATRWPTFATRRPVVVGFRPEELALAPDGEIVVELTAAEHVGSHHLVSATLDAPGAVQAGERVEIDPLPRSTISASFEHHGAPDLWRPVRLTFDAGALHLFDPVDGHNLAIEGCVA